jgi:hypothetical protein
MLTFVQDEIDFYAQFIIAGVVFRGSAILVGAILAVEHLCGTFCISAFV